MYPQCKLALLWVAEILKLINSFLSLILKKKSWLSLFRWHSEVKHNHTKWLYSIWLKEQWREVWFSLKCVLYCRLNPKLLEEKRIWQILLLLIVRKTSWGYISTQNIVLDFFIPAFFFYITFWLFEGHIQWCAGAMPVCMQGPRDHAISVIEWDLQNINYKLSYLGHLSNSCWC